jgi:UDP-N-acetylmuramoylalanine--D-glutamate ligase
VKLDTLKDKSLLILGCGVEGSTTFRVLRELFPAKVIGVADKNEGLADPILKSDENVRFHLGAGYLSHLSEYDVIIKSPGVSITTNPELKRAVDSGTLVTSQTALFFANCSGTIVGITGTKGKGTTSKLINDMLTCGGFDSNLVGNVGNPSLPLLAGASSSSIFVYELSAQQLEGMQQSPHIAVVLNIVPDHLDYFGTFDRYVEAKRNIVRFQSENDYLVYNAAFPTPGWIASTAVSQTVPYSIDEALNRGCFIDQGRVVWRMNGRDPAAIISLAQISGTLPQRFNLHNVLAAIAVGMLLGVETSSISDAIGHFEPLEHRFEVAGEYKGVVFYNASIATVPEVTIEHLRALGSDVQTMLLGGQDRGSDFSELARHIVSSSVRTLILFPGTGPRILDSVLARAAAENKAPPRTLNLAANRSPEATMRDAVELAYLHTEQGKICLHSPASASFGLFRDYRQRGELFKRFVKEIGEA